jgi:hypothetical protein
MRWRRRGGHSTISFDANLDEVRNSIVEGMKASMRVVSISQLNGAVGVLKELGQEAAAQEIIDFYFHKASADFWNKTDDPFQRGPLEKEIAAVIETRTEEASAPMTLKLNWFGQRKPTMQRQ